MKLKAAFVCIGNSCRSQMAEGFALKHGSDVLEVYSAGTEPAGEVKPNAILVMKEKGIDISSHYPKLLQDIPGDLDILITMGCGVECPTMPCKFREDWGLEDPVGQPVEFFRDTRDIIETRVRELLEKVRNNNI